MSNENIQITITENGSRRVAGGFKDIGDAASKSADSVDLLKHAIETIAIVEFAKHTLEVADAYTVLQNKIRLVTDSTAQLNVVTDHLVEIAAQTRTSLEDTALIYARTARNADTLGVSQNQLLAYTKALDEAVVLSGASAQESSAGLFQLSHAMETGSLQGRVLRSVLQDLPEVAQVIAKSLGTNIGGLKTLAAQGKITSQQIIQAFLQAKDSLDDKFSHSVATVGQAVTVLETRWESFIGKLNTSHGVTAAIAQGLIYLANNLDFVGRALGAVLITVLLLTNVGLPGLISKLVQLGTLILANPWMALATAIVAATAALITFGDEIQINEGIGITMRDVWVALWQDIKNAVLSAYNYAVGIFNKWSDAGTILFGNLYDSSISFPRNVARTLDEVLRLFMAVGGAIVEFWNQVWKDISSTFTYTWEAIKAKITGKDLLAQMSPGSHGAMLGSSLSDSIINGFVKGWDQLGEKGKGPVEGALNSLMDQAQLVANSRIEKEAMEANARVKAEASLDTKIGTATGADDPKFDRLIAKLKAEGELLKLNRLAREQANNALKFEQTLKRALTPQEFALVTGITAENDQLQQRSDVLTGLQAKSQDFLDKQKAINDVIKEAPALTAALTQELANLEIQMLQAQQGGSFADGYLRQLRIMQLQTRNAVADIGQSFASIFGPGGSLSKGLGDAIAHAIIFKENFAQAMKTVAQTVLTDVISSLIQLGINMAINAALGTSLGAAATAASIGEAAAVTAAWGPAATLVNAATFGAGSAAGTASLASSLATVRALSAAAGGFESGGYTGDLGRSTVAGVVHGREYVLNAAATSRIGVSNLNRMNAGGSAGAPTMNVTAINRDVPGMTFDTVRLSPTDVQIIARQTVHAEAGHAIANELSNPSSKTSRSLQQHTTAERRRS